MSVTAFIQNSQKCTCIWTDKNITLKTTYCIILFTEKNPEKCKYFSDKKIDLTVVDAQGWDCKWGLAEWALEIFLK